MKKILFGTSAMLAAAFASAGGASAAGLTLGMSGSYTFGGGFIYSDSVFKTPTSDQTIEGYLIADGGLAFEGKGTLDNGLTYGAVMKFDIENGGGFTNTDESYGYVSGSFGRVVIGHDDGAHDVSVIAAPCPGFSCAADGGGLLFDRATVLGGNWGFDGDETGDALKISYFTPAFSGFSAGVSYVPDATVGENGTIASTSVDDAWEVGAKFENTFNDVTVGVGGGYTKFNAGTGSDSWAVGAKLGYMGFTVGGAFEERASGDNGFGVGATYATGPWTFGAAYAQGDSIAGAAADARGVSVGLSYQLGKGVTVASGLEWADVGNQTAFGGGVVTNLSF